MKRLMCLVKLTLVSVFVILPSAASAALIITEVMSNSSRPGDSTDGDWWELTNTSAEDLSLNGYSWDDDDGIAGTSVFPNGIEIDGHSSIIIVDEPDTKVMEFRNTWELDSDDQVIGRTNFIGINFSGLSSGGDAVYLYDNENALVTRTFFGSARDVDDVGRSFAWDLNGVSVGRSVAGTNGAIYDESDLDVASPGETFVWSQTGDLVITEVMSDSAHPGGGSANGDWWELTNRGDSTIDVASYSWDDSDGIPDTTILPAADAPELTKIDPLEPGESILIVDEPRSNTNIGVTNGFREAWGIDNNVQIVSRDDVDPDGVAFSGLNNTADAVHIFNTDGELVARAAFGDSNGGGTSFEWNRAGEDLGFSVVDENGAYLALEDGLGVSPGDDVGSPGINVGTGGLLGDVNGDGAVNGLDVDPFVVVLLGGSYQFEADVNGDGVVNGLDVDPFVDIVVGGGSAAAVPEPSTFALLAIGLVALWVRRRR